jgi:hypothetical protein|tara:strand:+ start:10334 stop:10450 length:117 start_codon:yes stop_codon:yes gene_type:complete
MAFYTLELVMATDNNAEETTEIASTTQVQLLLWDDIDD